ncbi:transporter [Olsenella sp. DSM 107455]|uniref:Transporter n=1 Tax=Thermophilibacter gallinarum TaxID=2779357 RepID=A0ABR9QSQ1_9ACTN|nr:transporter [Thermophilibacter gallinarum]MBE5024004.1 transporter [Thermophilibacter gallinarum]
MSEGFGNGVRRRASAGIFAALHVLLLVYSLSGIFSKLASSQPFLSFEFVALYGCMLLVLFVYAIAWQQIIKRLPLSVAFANKAVTVVWGIVWGFMFFHEQVTASMVVGAAIVMAGVVLYSTDGDEKDGEEK